MVKALEAKMCDEWLKSLGLFSIEKSERRPHHSLQLNFERKQRGRC